jgi:hypothetical protein
MSSRTPDFRSLLNSALTGYTDQTGIDLLNHPLLANLEGCTSADAIIAVLHDQARPFHDLQGGDHTVQLLRQVKPIVNTLLALFGSGTLTGVRSLVSEMVLVFMLLF